MNCLQVDCVESALQRIVNLAQVLKDVRTRIEVWVRTLGHGRPRSARPSGIRQVDHQVPLADDARLPTHGCRALRSTNSTQFSRVLNPLFRLIPHWIILRRDASMLRFEYGLPPSGRTRRVPGDVVRRYGSGIRARGDCRTEHARLRSRQDASQTACPVWPTGSFAPPIRLLGDSYAAGARPVPYSGR